MKQKELLERQKTIRALLEEKDDEMEKDEVEEAKDDDKDETEDETDEKNEDVDHLSAIFSGAELSEETQEKLKTVFESAVSFEARKKVATARKQLAEQHRQDLLKVESDLREQADGYFSHVVEQWAAKNEVALKNKVRSEITESFIAGLHKLFLEHNINVPENQVDLVQALNSRVASLEEDIMEMSTKNSKMSEELETAQRDLTFLNLTEGMTELDKEKFSKLVEGKSYSTLDEYRRSATIIKESYFKQKNEPEPEVLTENVETKKSDSSVMEYASFLGRRFK